MKEQMDLEALLKQHENDYVCLNTNGWRKIALGSYFLKILDDYDLCEIPTSIESGADDYDIWVSIN